MDSTASNAIYRQLQILSWLILDTLGIEREPIKPERTCKWANGKNPIGVAYHFTGGPSAVKSMRWFNDPSWKNDSSSCHVLVFDRLPSDEVGHLWQSASPELLRLFPVPTIVLADWRWGTWCTNWVNRWCLGVEMRNVGYDVKPLGKYELQGKTPEILNTLPWEPYTRGQLISAINVGRLVRALPGFDPRYILGHSMVWATKSDPGPAFPLRLVRAEISSDSDPGGLAWLDDYPTLADGSSEDHASAWAPSADVRHQTGMDHPATPGAVEGDLAWVADALYDLGYPTGPSDAPERIRVFVGWYQRSTAAWATAGHPERVLGVDGVAGPKTVASLGKRLARLRLRP
jgi:N-acetyl-anhydromuramyl-L-alanine amidase AmpD